MKSDTESQNFTLHLEQSEGFDFRVKFDWPGVPELLLDEPEPLGGRHGPNAARLLAAAVANCLSASLVFCVRTKFKQDMGKVRASATGRLERNERGRLRIAGIDVTVTLSEDAGAIAHLDRCARQFEDFCIVTESVRNGIPVNVRVVDAAGHAIHASGDAEVLETGVA